MKRSAWIVLVGVMTTGCTSGLPKSDVSGTSAQTLPDIANLSDEFDSASSLAQWKHVDQVEGWKADQLETCAVKEGGLRLVPYTSTWYQDYRGVLLFKEITGDFIMTAKVRSTGRDGVNAPLSQFSLAGLMARAPRSDSADSWSPGKENYIFLSLGAADVGGLYKFEAKTTVNSQSTLELASAGGPEALLQIVRIGPKFFVLCKQGAWRVQKRYMRTDMPQQLQLGMTVYTDYPTASQIPPEQHNRTVLRGGHPDLIGTYDFVRFRRPKLPAGVDLDRATDAQLVGYFGEAGL